MLQSRVVISSALVLLLATPSSYAEAGRGPTAHDRGRLTLPSAERLHRDALDRGVFLSKPKAKTNPSPAEVTAVLVILVVVCVHSLNKSIRFSLPPLIPS